MERLKLKNMSLKRSLFLISFLCLLAAVALAAVAWLVIEGICERYYPGGGLVVDFSGIAMDWNEVSPEQQRIHDILVNLQLMLCMVLPLLGLAVAGLVFYRVKLKTPLALLLAGTKRIQNRDLDFRLEYDSKDELGQLCQGFEVMRSELLQSNRELWQQAEDRRRLNAAFAHDLRNPITVVKGAVKLLAQDEKNSLYVRQLATHISRIENYVEVMAGVQRLEDIPVRRGAVSGAVLKQNLAEIARTLAADCRVEVQADGLPTEVSIDSGLLAVVAENLIGNAARFAAERVSVLLKCSGESLVLTVADDGSGYPPQLLSEGVKPFGRFGEEPEHFGMGLYICYLICMKHGGDLNLRNAEDGGAVAEASFRII